MRLCRHCEQRLAAGEPGTKQLTSALCDACWSIKQLRRVYLIRGNHSTDREKRIMALRRLAETRQPLRLPSIDEELGKTPPL